MQKRMKISENDKYVCKYKHLLFKYLNQIYTKIAFNFTCEDILNILKSLH